MQQQTLNLAAQAHKLLLSTGHKVATAESCTSGLLAAALTHNAGSSAYFLGGVNAYSNDVKISLLDVGEDLLSNYGAVSSEVSKAMAAGIRKQVGADIAIALTGIAGPEGGTPEKPVGTVWLGFAAADALSARCLQLSGSRSEIREGAVSGALQHLITYLENHGSASPL